METIKAFIATMVFMLVIMIIIGTINLLATLHENVLDKEIRKTINESNITSISILFNGSQSNTSNASSQTLNLSDYDIYRKVRPEFRVLDVALAISVLAIVAGVFIYNSVRT